MNPLGKRVTRIPVAYIKGDFTQDQQNMRFFQASLLRLWLWATEYLKNGFFLKPQKALGGIFFWCPCLLLDFCGLA